jgi:hypothetical protein
MNRRKFLAQASGVIQSVVAGSRLAACLGLCLSGQTHLALDPSPTLAMVPPDFIGSGYEISSVSRPGLLSAQNPVYVRLVRTLGTRGVICIGGNTSDYAFYFAKGQPLSSPEGKAGSVVNNAVIRDLGTFLDSTGNSFGV